MLNKMYTFVHFNFNFFYNFMNPSAPLDTPHPVTNGRYRCRSCRRKSPALHWNEWDRVALSLHVACSVNGA